MPQNLNGLASLPQKQLIRKYYFPYRSPAAVIDGRSPRYRDVIQEVASGHTPPLQLSK
jgi:hypothetical protein